MKKVVILGAEGLLGSALKEKFAESYTVLGWGRGDLDISNHEEVDRKITGVSPDLVINAVAFNSVDLADKEETAKNVAEQINSHAVGNLAKICNQLGIPLVHYSTDYVFAGDNTEGNNEAVAPNPVNWYGKTKALGEKLVRENTDKYYLVRVSRLFGPPGTSKNAKKSFVDLMIDAVAKQGKKELKLVADEISSPTYSIDVAELTHNLVSSNFPYGIYHGANSGACSWYEFAKHIFELKGLEVAIQPVSSVEFPRPAKRPLHSALVNTKLPTQRHWRDALRDYLLS